MNISPERSSGEVVYGTGPGSTGGMADESRVMSERVQHLAASIYKEFEKMIQKHDEDSVKELMPLVVNVLESLDLAYLEKEEHEVELELLKEDNEQLVTQYEREKQLRRGAEQRLLEFEDHFEGEQKDLQDKVDSLESIVRMLELKGKNSTDHVGRLEERENELKQEFAKLHERYTELFKTHMDYMERTKFLMGNEKFDVINSVPGALAGGPRSKFAYSLSEHGAVGMRQVADLSFVSGRMVPPPSDVQPNLSSEMQAWPDDVFSGGEQVESCSREMTPRNLSKETPQSEVSVDDSLGADLTGGLVDPAEFASAEQQRSDNDNSESDDDIPDETFSLGMGKEVENLIKENTELMETKNALNIVKNDLIAKVDELSSEQEILREECRSLEMVRAKLNERIKELETELKDIKQQLDDASRNKDEEDDIPMAQRKRFTRVEMARVLMERNQYKEKLMELQEAVRWTEMIRASRNDPSVKRKKGSIWDFFSGLFNAGPTAAHGGPTQDVQTVNVRYSGATKQVLPGTDPLIRKKPEKPKAFDFLDAEYSSEKRAAERKEQYKLVKAHVKKDESGRLQAYGWSIPAIDTNQGSVPVPVYCRPLMDQEPNLRIWCAAGIILTGGRTKDGGEIVGSSVFYTKPKEEQPKTPPAEQQLESLDHELKIQQKEYSEFWNTAWEFSSLIWICSSAHGQSQVAVIDANNPSDVLESFNVCSSHLLCIESIPGARDSDYSIQQQFTEVSRPGSEIADGEPGVLVGEVRYVKMTVADDGITFSGPIKSPKKEITPGNADPETPGGMPADVTSSEKAEEILKSSSESGGATREKSPLKSRLPDQLPEHIKDGLSKYSGVGDVTTVLPTVWMGSQNGHLYIHSAVSEWRKCLRRIKLDDAVLSVVHYKGRIFAALANGTVVVLQRSSSGEWSTDGYHVIVLGKPQHSVRCLTVVAGNIWCGYKNLIFVLNPFTLKIEHCFAVHPRKESQVRQLIWVGDGVWCSIRLDSTLRLYHAHTYQHLQDVDIEPYVSQMLGTSKLGFSFVRITALLVSSKRLWIGTGNGVIISVPLTENVESLNIGTKQSSDVAGKKPGGIVRVYADPTGNSDRVKRGSFIPYSNMAQAQLSFHGHKDAVKFFVAVPGSVKTLTTMKTTTNDETTPKINDPLLHPTAVRNRKLMVVSGGDGYIDFRIGDEEDEETRQAGSARRDLSHLVVWEVQCETTE